MGLGGCDGVCGGFPERCRGWEEGGLVECMPLGLLGNDLVMLHILVGLECGYFCLSSGRHC